MKTFKHMNTTGPEVCPVCKTKEDKQVTLVPIYGTQEGNIAQAIQIHVDCINLTMRPATESERAILYQVLE
jgi:RNA polymerase subunit RPABC4/transcription elongation factor Spt4